MTASEERHWREQGPDVINAEMERRLAIWLERRTGARFQVRELCYEPSSPDGVLTRVTFRGTRAEAKRVASRVGRFCWVEHQDAPAIRRGRQRQVRNQLPDVLLNLLPWRQSMREQHVPGVSA